VGMVLCLELETGLMPEQPTEPPVNDGGNGSNNPSLLTEGKVLQASPEARKPPLRSHPKPSNGTQCNQTGGFQARRSVTMGHGAAHIPNEVGCWCRGVTPTPRPDHLRHCRWALSGVLHQLCRQLPWWIKPQWIKRLSS